MNQIKIVEGTPIFVTDNGKFTACIKGQNVEAGSLATMEKKIKTAMARVPIKAVYGRQIVTITGKRKLPGSWHVPEAVIEGINRLVPFYALHEVDEEKSMQMQALIKESAALSKAHSVAQESISAKIIALKDSWPQLTESRYDELSRGGE